MDATLKKIIEQLSEKTKAGQTNWVMGDSPNEYVLNLSHAIVSISVYTSGSGISYIDCKISNTRGDIILREHTQQSSESGQFLVSFFVTVRDAYTGKEDVISSIFNQLNSDKPIGEIPQSEDLPF